MLSRRGERRGRAALKGRASWRCAGGGGPPDRHVGSRRPRPGAGALRVELHGRSAHRRRHLASQVVQDALPALDNLGGLRHATAFNAVDRARFFLDDSAPTALERADGNWGPALRRLGSHHASAGATVAGLAAAFDKHLAPACRQPRTRADSWRAWRLVVTWAVARQASRARRPSWCGRPSRRVTGSFSSASRSARLTSTRRGSSCWARSAVGRWHSSCRSRRLRCGGCSHGGPRRWRRTGRAC
jgi:hypothetical protein